MVDDSELMADEDYDAEVSTPGKGRGRIGTYLDNRYQKKIDRQFAYEQLSKGEEKEISAQNIRPYWDPIVRGESSKIMHRPENYKTMSEEDRLAFDKKMYKMKRNEGAVKWFGKSARSGYEKGWKGEGKGGLSLIGKANPFTKKGRGNVERVGLEKAKTGIVHAGKALGTIGGAFGAAGAGSFQPVQIFTMAWKRMSVTLKWLVILVFLVVILFVPWGVFYYTGWAVGAAFMFLISLIYWAFASFFNAIAYVLVTAINAVASIIMGVIIWIVEFFMSIFMKPNYVNPKSGGYEYYWVAGHDLFDNALLRYSDLATVPTLMVPITPEWQPWMNQILIVKLFELIPGLQPIANAFTAIGRAMGSAFESIIVHSPPWMVILIGLLPIILVAAIGIYVYKKYSNEARVL